MNTIEIKRHFVQSEFLKSKTIPKDHDLTFNEEFIIDWWIVTLTLIREFLGFKITVTDGLRVGDKTSQHYYDNETSEMGAVDIRPTEKMNSTQIIQLGLVLATSAKIKRVCYYPPSSRAEYGIFHCDCKGTVKTLWVNEGEEINWEPVSLDEFFGRIRTHAEDIKG